jgi:hypothetical protein
MQIDRHTSIRIEITKYIVLIFAIFHSLGCEATTIAILRNKSGIVVSADSLVGSSEGASSTTCKIIPAGNGFFAVAGIADSGNIYRTFNARKIAAQVGKESTVKKRADAFRQLALPSFRAAIKDIRRYDPEFFSKMKDDPQPLQAMFFGIEDGIAVFQVEVFSLTVTQKEIFIKPSRRACPGICTETVSLEILGENAAAKAASRLVKDGGVIDPHNLVESSRKLVEIEEKASPKYVGGAVVSVIVSAFAPPAWIDPSHMCDSPKH